MWNPVVIGTNSWRIPRHQHTSGINIVPFCVCTHDSIGERGIQLMGNLEFKRRYAATRAKTSRPQIGLLRGDRRAEFRN